MYQGPSSTYPMKTAVDRHVARVIAIHGIQYCPLFHSTNESWEHVTARRRRCHASADRVFATIRSIALRGTCRSPTMPKQGKISVATPPR